MSIVDVLNDSAIRAMKSGQYNAKYIAPELPELDLSVNDRLDEYSRISEPERTTIQKRISADMAWLLLCFGIRMAVFALRLSSQRYFTNGLLALSLACDTLDQREILIVLPLYWDAHKKNNLSFEHIIKQNNGFSGVIKEFIQRHDKDKSLECMGYVLSRDTNGNPYYERTW